MNSRPPRSTPGPRSGVQPPEQDDAAPNPGGLLGNDPDPQPLPAIDDEDE